MKNFTFFFLFIPVFLFSQMSVKFSQNKIVYYNSGISKPADFFISNAEKLGLTKGYQMKPKNSNIDKSGIKHLRFNQYYKGIKVIGGTYLLHYKNGKIIKSSGSIFPGINLNINPDFDISVTKDKAKYYVLKDIQKENNKMAPLTMEQFEIEVIQLCIINKSFPSFDGDYRLAYDVLVTKENSMPPVKIRIYIDANTGEKILSYNEICTGNSHGKGKSIYYGTVDLDTDSLSAELYYLNDKTRGNGIYVKNYWDDGTEFTDSDNYWEFDDEGENSAIDALFCTQAYYDFMNEKFNRNSVDNKGMALNVNVNIKSFVNAYWDGESSTFGSGDCDNYSPLTTMAIVGHEFTHGMTQFTSGLVYMDEPGALNEAISDIFGESLEYFRDSSNFDWTVGTRIRRNSYAEAFRSMKEPNKYENPMYYHGKYWSDDFFDNGGVHSNSSVLNHWFYILAEGKSGITEKKDTFDAKPIGIRKALDIVYQMETSYLTENSGFADAFIYSIEAAKDLFGEDSILLNNLKEAWKAVGIPQNLNTVNKDDKLDFLILYNDRLDLFTRFCWDELSDLEMKFINTNPFPIDSGTTIYLKVKPYKVIKTGNHWGKTIDLDSFYFEKHLDRELEPDSFFSFTLNIDTAGYNLDKNYFALNIAMKLVKDTNERTFYDIGNINLTDEEESYRTLINTNKIENCDSKEKSIDYLRLFVFNDGCRPYQPEDSIIVKLKHQEDSTGIVFEVTKGYYIIDILIIDNIQDLFDFHSIENLNEYTMEIYYKSDMRTTLIFDEPLDNYILIPLQKDRKIDFEDDFYRKTLSINVPSFNCDTTIVGGKLKISSKWETDIEKCLSYEDYFKTMQNNYFSFMTEVSFCSEIDSMTNPYLFVDLKIEDRDNCNYCDYKHILQVKQGEVPIDYVSRSSVMSHFEFPLDKDYSPKISLSFITQGSSFFIDNIQLVDKKTIKTDDIEISRFGVVNPIQNNIKVIASDADINYNFDLYTVNGIKVLKKRNITGNLNENIDLPQGIYYYRITDKDSILDTGKIISIKN